MKSGKPSCWVRRQQGFSLIETLVAVVILLVGMVGLLGLFAVAAIKNANQGDDATRTTEYANDKLEQLMGLRFIDPSSDTTQFPTCYTGANTTCSGTGLGDTSLTVPLATNGTVGGLNTNSPVTGYYDYISGTGAFVGTSYTNASFLRQWSITASGADSVGNATVKTITVQVISLRGLAQGATKGKLLDIQPKTVLIGQKTNFSPTGTD